MPDYAQAVIFWIAGTLFGLGVASRGEKDAKNICALALATLACAIALVLLLGVTGEVLQNTNVGALIDRIAVMIAVGDRRAKTVPPHPATPTPVATPVPSDISAPAAEPTGFLHWLLYTPDKEG